jgi:hypothetical protein
MLKRNNEPLLPADTHHQSHSKISRPYAVLKNLSNNQAGLSGLDE